MADRRGPDQTPHPLTRIRWQRSWSMADVARLVQQRTGLNMATWRQKIYRWEHGVVPEPAAQAALAAELGVDQLIVQRLGWPAWLMVVDRTDVLDAPWTAQAAHEVLGLVVESAPVDRRNFLTFTGAAIASALTGWRTTPPPEIVAGLEGRTVGAEVAAALTERVAELWRLDDLLGGGATLDAAVADLRIAQQVLGNARYNTEAGRQLWRAVAALARMAGWSAFDSGRLTAAEQFWIAGLRAAHAGDDQDQGVYILSNLALQAIYANDGADAIQILEGARVHCDPAHRVVLAMLATWQSRAHSLIGEGRQAASLLNKADDLWSNRIDGSDPEYIYWMPRPTTTAEAGTALLAIGETNHAQQSLLDGLTNLDHDSARDRNLYHIRLAETHLTVGDLDQAHASARNAIDSVTGINSHRVRDRIDSLIAQMPHTTGTAELREYLRTTDS